MPIEYIKGDILENLPDYPIIICQVVNSERKMGRGFALALMTKWPIVREEYIKSECRLGTCGFISVSTTTIVVNMVAQHGLKSVNNKRPLKYHHLAGCMDRVGSVAKAGKKEIFTVKFGSDLAGGRWEFIEELIQDIWLDNGLKVTIFHF